MYVIPFPCSPHASMILTTPSNSGFKFSQLEMSTRLNSSLSKYSVLNRRFFRGRSLRSLADVQIFVIG